MRLLLLLLLTIVPTLSLALNAPTRRTRDSPVIARRQAKRSDILARASRSRPKRADVSPAACNPFTYRFRLRLSGTPSGASGPYVQDSTSRVQVGNLGGATTWILNSDGHITNPANPTHKFHYPPQGNAPYVFSTSATGTGTPTTPLLCSFSGLQLMCRYNTPQSGYISLFQTCLAGGTSLFFSPQLGSGDCTFYAVTAECVT